MADWSQDDEARAAIDKIADALASQYGAARVKPPAGDPGSWTVEGDRLGTVTCRFVFDRAGRFVGAWDPDDAFALLNDDGLIHHP